jgi:hypothetical protein
MSKIDENVGALVAADTKDTLRALDDAILSKLRLCTTLMESFDAAQLPVGSSQKLLQSMASGINHIVAGRAEMASTVKTLHVIKAGSSLAATAYNCPGDPATGIMLARADSPKMACPEASFG